MSSQQPRFFGSVLGLDTLPKWTTWISCPHVFSHWTFSFHTGQGGGFSQIFSTLDHFHVLLNSQPRDLWGTPPKIYLDVHCLSELNQSCLHHSSWIVTPWCSPGIIAVPGASASFGWGPSFCEEPQIRLCLWWVVAGQEMEIHPRERKRMALKAAVNETFTDNYFHLLDRRDGEWWWQVLKGL